MADYVSKKNVYSMVEDVVMAYDHNPNEDKTRMVKILIKRLVKRAYELLQDTNGSCSIK